MTTPMPKIGAPAKRALKKVNITALEQLTKIDEKSLLKLHGLGPKAVETLKDAMAEANLSMLKEPMHSFSTDFLVFGDLKCDNAPKKRIIRDYLILLWMNEETVLSKVVSENVLIHQVKSESLAGIESLINIIAEEAQSIISLEITQLLTHGKEGSAHGVITFDSGTQKYFAEFYTFESHKKDARIKNITQYLIA